MQWKSNILIQIFEDENSEDSGCVVEHTSLKNNVSFLGSNLIKANS